MEEGVINRKDTKADVSKHSEQHVQSGKESENSSKDFPESTSSHDDDVHTVDGSPFKNKQVCFSILKTISSYIGILALSSSCTMFLLSWIKFQLNYMY